MLREKANEDIMDDMSEQTGSERLCEQARKEGSQAFSRKGKMGCRLLVLMILEGIHSQLQKAIDEMYEHLKMGVSVTRQAVSKARSNLEPEFIRGLFIRTADIASSCEDLEVYAGKYRLCAIDGSGVSLKQSLAERFGTSNEKATALASLAYDPLNDIIMDARLERWGSGERKAAQANIEACEKIGHGAQFIYIFDRGYPSGEFLGWMIKKKLKFVVRAGEQATAYKEAKGNGEWVSLDYEPACYKVRVIKLPLESSETETLVTNLDEADLLCEQAKELYFKRWRIEVKLEELKTKLALERMRGKREVVVMQDFYATMWLSNVGATLRWRTEATIEQADATRELKYKRKTDVNRLYTKLRGKFYLVLTALTDEQRHAMLDSLQADIARFPVDIKPNRSAPRSLGIRPRPCDLKNCAGL
jgi:hypothetical protein